jgi:hypothetical protein
MTEVMDYPSMRLVFLETSQQAKLIARPNSTE